MTDFVRKSRFVKPHHASLCLSLGNLIWNGDGSFLRGTVERAGPAQGCTTCQPEWGRISERSPSTFIYKRNRFCFVCASSLLRFPLYKRGDEGKAVSKQFFATRKMGFTLPTSIAGIEIPQSINDIDVVFSKSPNVHGIHILPSSHCVPDIWCLEP